MRPWSLDTKLMHPDVNIYGRKLNTCCFPWHQNGFKLNFVDNTTMSHLDDVCKELGMKRYKSKRKAMKVSMLLKHDNSAQWQR